MPNTAVALITYNRPQHTEKVLSALRRHSVDNLYIFSDGPKSDEHLSQVWETRLLFQRIDWTRPVIVERDVNIGLAKSIVSAADMIFESFDRLILLEDDCVPQSHFFDFISDSLNKYENYPRVFGISGYSVPVPEKLSDAYPYDAYFFPRIGSWGWATWKSRWALMQHNLSEAHQKLCAQNIDLNQGGTDVPEMVTAFLKGHLKDVWTLNWILTVYLNQGVYVYPTRSHIENVGMDGSGVHCGATDLFETPIASSRATAFPDDVTVIPELASNFRKYYDLKSASPAMADTPFSNGPRLKVVHLSTIDTGGAANAAFRIHKGLQAAQIDSTFLVLNKSVQDDSIKIFPENAASIQPATSNSHSPERVNACFKRWRRLTEAIQGRPEGLELFSDLESDVSLALTKDLIEADIIHFHWVAGLIDYKRLPQAIYGKPVVWTLHDMNPFTGGCHYAGDCLKYQHQCGYCPQLSSETNKDLSRQNWDIKARALMNLNLTVVTPSRWLERCAAKSSIFSNFKRKIIPYGIPTNTFKPSSPDRIRKHFDIPESTRIVLFGADSANNKRKGLDYLFQSIHILEKLGDDKLDFCIVVFGDYSESSSLDTDYPLYATGPVHDQSLLAELYSAADVFVLPSLEDNLPNTVLESLACGTPVVGFDTGGIPDMVHHKHSGFIAKTRDAEHLAEGIKWILEALDDNISFSAICRQQAEQNYTLEIQANGYIKLYSEIMSSRTKSVSLFQEDINFQISEAMTLVENGKIKDAQKALGGLLEKHPGSPVAHRALAMIYRKTGVHPKMIIHEQTAFLLEGDPASFEKPLARYLFAIKADYQAAMTQLMEAFKNHRQALDTLFMLGCIASTIENERYLQEFNEEMRSVAPENLILLSNLANYHYLIRNDTEEALTLFVQALKLDPKNINTLMALGSICGELGKKEDAAGFFQMILDMHPSDPDAREYLDQLVPPAANGLPWPRNRLVEGFDSPQISYDIVQALIDNRHYEGAAKAIAIFLTLFPDFALAHSDLGRLYLNSGKLDESLECHRRAVLLAPADATFQKNLADLLFSKLGKTEKP